MKIFKNVLLIIIFFSIAEQSERLLAQTMACCTYEETINCHDMTISELSDCVELMDGDPYPFMTCENTNCLEQHADKFACCLSNGDCVDVIGRDACYTTLNAIPFARNTCPNVACEALPRNGICCTPAEECSLSLEIACDNYFIEGAICEEDACAPIRGACCTVFGCELLSEEICSDSLGVFHGIGSACDPLLCERGCCQGNECEIESDLICELRGGTSMTTLQCEEETCDGLQMACCLSSNNGTECLELDETTCLDAGGTAHNGLFCEELTCPESTELSSACCTNSLCSDLSVAQCFENGGQSLSGISCGNLGSCPPPEFGACCVASPFSICSDRASENSCNERAGIWYRETHCAELDETICNVISGSCCKRGMCSESFNSAECESDGGRFINGVSCDEIDCNQGACCLGEFGCANSLYEDQCDFFEGSFFQAQRCREIECESACCTDDGACQNLLRETCETIDGVTIGRGVLCSHMMTCPTISNNTFACCERDFCTNSTIDTCNGLLYYGLQCDDFTDSTCPYIERGACCLDQDLCAESTIERTCSASGGNFYADLTCDEANDSICHPQTYGACCTNDICTRSTERSCGSGEWTENVACEEIDRRN